MYTSVLSIGRAYRHITQRFRSRTPRRYCHLITLVTSVYRKTNVCLTTVGTGTPPGGKMCEGSPLEKTTRLKNLFTTLAERNLLQQEIIHTFLFDCHDS
jgi:hypothetical protein